MSFKGDDIEVYDDIVREFDGRGSYIYAPKKLDHYMKNSVTPPTRASIKEPPVLELEALLYYLHYSFFRRQQYFSNYYFN